MNVDYKNINLYLMELGMIKERKLNLYVFLLKED